MQVHDSRNGLRDKRVSGSFSKYSIEFPIGINILVDIIIVLLL